MGAYVNIHPVWVQGDKRRCFFNSGLLKVTFLMTKLCCLSICKIFIFMLMEIQKSRRRETTDAKRLLNVYPAAILPEAANKKQTYSQWTIYKESICRGCYVDGSVVECLSPAVLHWVLYPFRNNLRKSRLRCLFPEQYMLYYHFRNMAY